MKLVQITKLATVALAIFVGGFQANSVVAQEKHSHAEAMKKAELKISETLKSLSPEDQKLVAAQRFCPMMTYSRLGAMGAPVKLTIAGKPVFVCCESCVEDAVKGGKDTLIKAKELTEASAVLAKLPAEDRAAAEAQKYCAVQNKSLLGSMGAPVKLDLDGTQVLLCCKGCTGKAQANPEATLAKVEELKNAGVQEEHGDHEHGDHKHEAKANKKK